MGYHDGQDIPNYWAYARNFVLNDHMFESVSSYSVPSHLYMVSAWSAVCSQPNVASSCRNSNNTPPRGPAVIFPGAAGRKVREPLCRFLGVAVPDVPFPRLNDREAFQLLVWQAQEHGAP